MSLKKYILTEMARQTDIKIVEYEQKDDKVRAILHNSTAGNVTKLGNELNEVLTELKKYKEREKKLKETLRDVCDELFDEADETITKFLITQHIMITVGATSPSKKEIFDWDGFFEKISEVCGLGVDSLKAIQQQFTKIETGPGKTPSIRVKKMKENFMNEDIIPLFKKIRDFTIQSVEVIKRLFSSPMEKRLRELTNELKLEGIHLNYEEVLKSIKK